MYMFFNVFFSKKLIRYQSILYINKNQIAMSLTLSECISENITKFSQPKNPIYKMVYVINSCNHDVQYLSSEKITRLAELVENLDDCKLKQTNDEKRLDMSYETRVLHKKTLLSRTLFDNIRKGNIIVEVPFQENDWNDIYNGDANYVFVSMERVA